MIAHQHSTDVIIGALEHAARQWDTDSQLAPAWALHARDLADDLRSGELELRHCSEAEPSDGPGWRDVPVVLFTLAFGAVAYGAGGWPW